MALMQRNRSEQSGGLANRPQDGAVPLSQVMQRLFQDSVLLPAVFDGFGSAAGTAGTNLWESSDSYTIQVAMPGMRAESIQATVEQDMLMVRGESAMQAPERATALWQTFGGEVAYRIPLPGEVEAGQAEASYEQGILTVRLPKVARAQARTITVTAK